MVSLQVIRVWVLENTRCHPHITYNTADADHGCTGSETLDGRSGFPPAFLFVKKSLHMLNSTTLISLLFTGSPFCACLQVRFLQLWFLYFMSMRFWKFTSCYFPKLLFSSCGGEKIVYQLYSNR